MKFGSLLGVGIHISPWLLIVFVLCIILGVGFDLFMLFFIVFLHEFCHALMARAFKVDVSDVELMPFGGVARMEGAFEIYPKAEICIALAGPLCNLFLCMATALLLYVQPDLKPQLGYFMQINFLLFCLNMLPAMPLDGGRILRATLTKSLGFCKATKITVGLGMLLAGCIFSYGVVGALNGVVNITILATPVFLFFAARRENRKITYHTLRDMVGKSKTFQKEGTLPVNQLAMSGMMTLEQTIKKFTPRQYHVITVLDDNMEVKGVLTENQVFSGFLTHGPSVSLLKLLKVH